MARGGAIYLGNDAEIEFERTGVQTYGTLLRENIVATANNSRFSFDYADSILITGDKVRITRTDKDTSGGYKNLILKDGHNSNSWQFYVYVDMLGRIYCYDNLGDAITSDGETAGIQLTKGFTNQWEKESSGDYYQNIKIEVIEAGFRPFAKCNDYQLTTTRDTIDVTTLGKYFYQQWENGLIGGQGTVTALWDEQALTSEMCDDPYVKTPGGDELAAYFAKLILRIQIGAGFKGRFYLRTRDDDREPEADRWAVFWQADCVCTNVAVQAEPGAILKTRIDFVTTGLFQLEIADRKSTTSLAQETGILLEREGDAGLLLTD